jgi:hypothetical protein
MLVVSIAHEHDKKIRRTRLIVSLSLSLSLCVSLSLSLGLVGIKALLGYVHKGILDCPCSEEDHAKGRRAAHHSVLEGVLVGICAGRCVLEPWMLLRVYQGAEMIDDA